MGIGAAKIAHVKIAQASKGKAIKAALVKDRGSVFVLTTKGTYLVKGVTAKVQKVLETLRDDYWMVSIEGKAFSVFGSPPQQEGYGGPGRNLPQAARMLKSYNISSLKLVDNGRFEVITPAQIAEKEKDVFFYKGKRLKPMTESTKEALPLAVRDRTPSTAPIYVVENGKVYEVWNTSYPLPYKAPRPVDAFSPD